MPLTEEDFGSGAPKPAPACSWEKLKVSYKKDMTHIEKLCVDIRQAISLLADQIKRDPRSGISTRDAAMRQLKALVSERVNAP